LGCLPSFVAQISLQEKLLLPISTFIKNISAEHRTRTQHWSDAWE